MKKFPKSTGKYLRREKAKIRREIWDPAEQNRRIRDLLEKVKTQYNGNTNKTGDEKLKSRNSDKHERTIS